MQENAMIFRKALLATTMLMLPLAAEAQAPTEPVTGIYLGAAGGFNIKTSPKVNNIVSNVPGGALITTPNGSLSTSLGGAAVGSVGYGLGNGLRVEIEGDYRGNSFSNVSRNNLAGVGVSTSASGSERLYGPMFNVDYDFLNLVPYVVPYVGVGLGYQRAQLQNFSATSNGRAGATITSQDTRAAFTVQG